MVLCAEAEAVDGGRGAPVDRTGGTALEKLENACFYGVLHGGDQCFGRSGEPNLRCFAAWKLVYGEMGLF